jgi:Skp family chaperone for outer membrane proteins
VKKSRFSAVLAAIGLLAGLGYCGVTMAQAPAAQPAGAPRMALLDVGRIFKSHQRFKSAMEDMKRDVEEAERRVKAERERIAKLAESMQQFHKGTQDYNDMERELAKAQADLQVQVSLQKNQFLQREAKTYHDVYQEIWQATDYFCKQNRIDMVLRFNGDKADVDRPDSVLSQINRPVVWYDPGLDITDQILADLNRTPAGGNSGQATRPTAPFAPQR